MQIGTIIYDHRSESLSALQLHGFSLRRLVLFVSETIKCKSYSCRSHCKVILIFYAVFVLMYFVSGRHSKAVTILNESYLTH